MAALPQLDTNALGSARMFDQVAADPIPRGFPSDQIGGIMGMQRSQKLSFGQMRESGVRRNFNKIFTTS